MAPYELSQLCRGQAANRFDRRPSEITVNAPIRQRDGSTVQGWYDREGKRTAFFTCRFDQDNRFLSVY
ncbi:YsaB family lipoprotein [Novosphingobium sp.]|uniref:YsaB family lipoprotein n=1 Tax=Novosphingobium sp. TaxID=1874826 RepID=UPI0039182257